VNSRAPLYTEASAAGELARVLERRFEVERAVPVSRAALGLSIVLEWWRETRGTCRVALPGAICHEVVVAVLAAGCEPIFCDVDPADGLVTQTEWLRARSLGADAAIAVHLYGNPADVEAVRRVFTAPNCLLIDDAAQALGSYDKTCAAGAGGDIGLLSFGPTKQISTGNAALLFRSSSLADEFAARLLAKAPQPQAVRRALTSAFRSRLEVERQRLRTSHGGSRRGFCGLLQGLEPVLAVPYSPQADAATLRALAAYSEASEIRVAKRDLWASGLAGTTLQPVGMGRGCVPWRYACRSPGLDWLDQQRLAETLRAAGMHVSNWYLPAHWFVGDARDQLPGVEALAREVFQFWLDEETSLEAVALQSATVRRVMTESYGISQ
jgi:hypothetical protein